MPELGKWYRAAIPHSCWRSAIRRPVPERSDRTAGIIDGSARGHKNGSVASRDCRSSQLSADHDKLTGATQQAVMRLFQGEHFVRCRAENLVETGFDRLDAE